MKLRLAKKIVKSNAWHPFCISNLPMLNRKYPGYVRGYTGYSWKQINLAVRRVERWKRKAKQS